MTDHSPVIAHVVGARPNFVKAAPVVAALGRSGIRQVVIHTGQHYDPILSDVFFRDLGLPDPDVNLGVGSGSPVGQVAALLVPLERELAATGPALTIVYGDVNSTLAATLAATKLGLRVAHVEAGLRSFDESMPEEMNRRITDQLADLLFVTSPEGIDNLAAEGIADDGVHFVGNPMIDTLFDNLDRFDPTAIRTVLALPERYAVATIHRPGNVDDPARATRIAAMLRAVAAVIPLVLPLHPRGRGTLRAAGLASDERLVVIDALGYLDFLSLVRGATLVVTDSGGVQEETTALGVPCLTVRPNTERPITISHGTNRLVEPGAVAAAAAAIVAAGLPPVPEPPPLWDGHAGERIARIIERWLRAPKARVAGRSPASADGPFAAIRAAGAPR